MLVLGPEITTVLFAHGNTSAEDALVIARVMQMFAIALVPFSIYQLMLRVFYSHGDTKTPALIGMVSVTCNIAMAFTAYNVLGVKWIVVGIVAGSRSPTSSAPSPAGWCCAASSAGSTADASSAAT